MGLSSKTLAAVHEETIDIYTFEGFAKTDQQLGEPPTYSDVDSAIDEVKRSIEVCCATAVSGITVVCRYEFYTKLLRAGLYTRAHNEKYPHSKKKLLRHYKRRAKRK